MAPSQHRSLSQADLASATLARQFPDEGPDGAPGLVDVVARLGPVQTQVPRAAFLFAASRMPGTTYADVVAAFEDHDLVKASTLRGTVHTSTAEQHPWLVAATAEARERGLGRELRLEHSTSAEVGSEIERVATGHWVERSDLVAQIADWLSTHESGVSADRLSETTSARNHVWGHPSLVRRPPDGRWQTRTDTLHRDAGDLLARTDSTPHEALVRLVHVHLGALGPATRRDIAWWAGARLTDVDRAVDALGDEVVRRSGPRAAEYLDLEGAAAGGDDPGLRLLPEFDGLLLGYQGDSRDRFADSRHLRRLTGADTRNAVMLPLVLHEGRLVGQWRPVTRAGRTVLDVMLLPGCDAPAEDEFTAPAAAVGTALGLDVADVQVTGT